MIPESDFLANAPVALSKITKKVLCEERLSIEDGLELFASPHGDYINQLASFVRQKKVGNAVAYASTMHLYPSNICCLACPICSFYANEGDKRAFIQDTTSLAQMVERLVPYGISQVHIVSGLYPKLTLDYYKELFNKILLAAPEIEIKALSAVEYDYLATISDMPVSQILEELIACGLSFLPGGGAEIFDEDLRRQIAPKKISAARYLEIHHLAHELGLRSNCTMLYNHIEKPIHVVHHLQQIRTLQDKTHGFQAFVPLKYHPKNNALGNHLQPCGVNHRLYPVSRLMLDNVDHICALWNYEGLSSAQKLLAAGVSHIGNVTYNEQVATRAGAPDSSINEQSLEDCIKAANRIPLRQRRKNYA